MYTIHTHVHMCVLMSPHTCACTNTHTATFRVSSRPMCAHLLCLDHADLLISPSPSPAAPCGPHRGLRTASNHVSCLALNFQLPLRNK